MEFYSTGANQMGNLYAKNSHIPSKSIIMLPNYTAFFKYNKRELNREVEYLVPDLSLGISDES